VPVSGCLSVNAVQEVDDVPLLEGGGFGL